MDMGAAEGNGSKGAKKRQSTADDDPPPPPPTRPPPRPKQLNQLNQTVTASGKPTAARSKVASPVMSVPPGLGTTVVDLANDLAATNSQNKKVTWHNCLSICFKFIKLINQQIKFSGIISKQIASS